MRPLAGPAMLLVVVLGFTAYRMLQKPHSPDRDFTDLELAAPEAGMEGSCYSLGTVLVANGIFGAAPRTWTRLGKGDKWSLAIERVTQGYNGPAREFVTWTFERRDQEVRLTAVEASKNLPQTTQESLDQMLVAPNDRHSTPVDRCIDRGATGYRYKRK